MEVKSFLNEGTKKSFTVVILKKSRNDGLKISKGSLIMLVKRFLNDETKKVPQ